MKNEAKINIVGKWSQNSESNGNVYDTNGLSPTIVSGAHGGCEPRIKEENVPINTDAEGNARTVNSHYPCMNMDSVTRKSETGYGYVRTAVINNFRIRKLTERECFRLMGVREKDITKLLSAGISKTQLYKLAGNSIVCDVLMGIFSNLLIATDNDELF